MSPAPLGPTDRVSRRPSVARAFERTASVVLVTTVAASPWLVTPLRPATGRWLSLALGLGCACWLIGLLVARRRPAISAVVVIAVAAVVIDAILMLSTGAWDLRRVSIDVAVPLTAVLLSGLALVDLGRRTAVRTALLWAMAGSAALLSALAVVGRWGPDLIDVDHDPTVGGTPFVTFGYHGNAATFLVLGLMAALLLDVLEPAARTSIGRVLPRACAFAIVCGTLVNVSKAGLVLAVLALGTWMWLGESDVGRSRTGGADSTRHLTRPQVMMAGSVLLVIGVAGAWSRWSTVSGAMSPDGGRVWSWRAALHVWGRSPIVGSGPGTYKELLPEVVADEVPQLFRRWIVQDYEVGRPESIWMHAHNDVLQALGEWGVVGTLVLVALVGGVLTVAVIGARRTHGADRNVHVAGAIAISAVVVHSLIDFPFHVVSLQLATASWAAIVLATARSGRGTPSVSSMAHLNRDVPFSR